MTAVIQIHLLKRRGSQSKPDPSRYNINIIDSHGQEIVPANGTYLRIMGGWSKNDPGTPILLTVYWLDLKIKYIEFINKEWWRQRESNLLVLITTGICSSLPNVYWIPVNPRSSFRAFTRQFLLFPRPYHASSCQPGTALANWYFSAPGTTW